MSSSSSSDLCGKSLEAYAIPQPSTSPQLHPEISTSGLVGHSTTPSEPILSTSFSAAPRVQGLPRSILGCSVPASEVLTLTSTSHSSSSYSSRRLSGHRRPPSKRGRPFAFDEEPDLAAPEGKIDGERHRGKFVKRRVGETVCLRNLGLQVVSCLMGWARPAMFIHTFPNGVSHISCG